MKMQYMAGGMVIFLEAGNEEKRMHFYEDKNGFKRFDKKEIKVLTFVDKGKDKKKKTKMDQCSIPVLDPRLESIFVIDHCQDIVEYELAKKKGLEKLL